MGTVHVLAVDDSADTLEIIRRNLQRAGYDVTTASTVDEAIQRIGRGSSSSSPT